MHHPLSAFAALLLISSTPAFAAKWTYEPKVQNCEIGYIMEILRKGQHKAVATTGGRPLGVHPTACGFSSGEPTRKAARERALANCRKSASAAYPGECEIIEVQ
jgi:hypothetical protein